MSYIPMKPVLDVAYKHGIAFGAFNINTPEQGKVAIEIHEMFRTAAILQVIDFANGYMSGRKDYLNATLQERIDGAKVMVERVRRYAENAAIPVVLHLDHGSDPEFVKACVDCGYSSVMIDGSHLPFDENAALTADIVKYAHAKGVTVEAELGVLAGREDHAGSNRSLYTDPNKVPEFFRRTGVDCLAISYGTSHGPSKGKGVVIRKEIAIAAQENLRHEGIPGVLVSHGSSTVPAYLVEGINALGGNLKDAAGIPIEQVLEVIPYGIGKINVGTDLRLSILRYVREYFSKHPEKKINSSITEVWKILDSKPELIDSRVYLGPVADSIMKGIPADSDIKALMECAEKGVKEIVGQLIIRFGQVGYADKVDCVTLEQMAKRYKTGE